jgi:hypothetical protein
MVALSDLEFGRAIDVLDLSGIFYYMLQALFISTYMLAEEFIYGPAHHMQ